VLAPSRRRLFLKKAMLEEPSYATGKDNDEEKVTKTNVDNPWEGRGIEAYRDAVAFTDGT